MKELRDQIINAYYQKYYTNFFALFNQYISNGYGIDIDLICKYIKVLIRTNKYDKAYKMLRWLERYSSKYPSLDEDLFIFYYFCFKPKDAERIYRKGNVSTKHKTIIVKNYLLQGKIEEAKELLTKFIEEEQSRDLFLVNRTIYNHEHYGAFIETDYESFIRNGNELAAGHIIYLKHEPDSIADVREDEKCANRPYMIWKIEGKKLFLFPVTTVVKPNSYVLLKKNYPNSIGDRTIKDRLCTTSLNNVLSVSDKLREFDYNTVISNIYKSTYFSRSSENKKSNDTFMREYHREVEKYEVIKIVDLSSKNKRYYLVLDVNDKYYEVIELNDECNVISNKVGLFKKDCLFYTSFALSAEQLENVKSQLAGMELTKTFVGANIETNAGKHVVLFEKGDNCVCVSIPFSASYINMMTIKKNEIRSTHGFRSDEEIEEIRNLITRNKGINFQRLLKKL